MTEGIRDMGKTYESKCKLQGHHEENKKTMEKSVIYKSIPSDHGNKG